MTDTATLRFRGDPMRRALVPLAVLATLAACTSPTSLPTTTTTGQTVGDGIWTVGQDIPAGTYQTAADVADGCYWWLYRQGSDPAEIVDNVMVSGTPDGGRPTVTLESGQTWQVWHCGTWQRVTDRRVPPARRLDRGR